MSTLKRNDDGTFSVVHTTDEVAAAERANAATAAARAAQAEADARRAAALSLSRVSALAGTVVADVVQASQDPT